MKAIALILVSTFLAISVKGQNIDTEKSIVNFSLSNMKVNTVKGSLAGIKGTVDLDKKNLSNSTIDVTIDVETINTNNKGRDKHLKKEDFFDVKKYPTIQFKSVAFIKSKKEGFYIVKGKLTLHGITKEIKVPFSYENNSFKGYLQINRLDYGVGATTGTFMVGDSVNIKIAVVTK